MTTFARAGGLALVLAAAAGGTASANGSITFGVTLFAFKSCGGYCGNGYGGCGNGFCAPGPLYDYSGHFAGGGGPACAYGPGYPGAAGGAYAYGPAGYDAGYGYAQQPAAYAPGYGYAQSAYPYYGGGYAGYWGQPAAGYADGFGGSPVRPVSWGGR